MSPLTQGLNYRSACDNDYGNYGDKTVGLHRISAPALANPKSGHFFRNPAKSSSGQISNWIWQISVQL